MTREELKAHYSTIIKNGKISERGGAGLGMTDIALKARSKLNYTFNIKLYGSRTIELILDDMFLYELCLLPI